jgi:hypothetical protein
MRGKNGNLFSNCLFSFTMSNSNENRNIKIYVEVVFAAASHMPKIK